METTLSESAKLNIRLLEAIQEKYDHPEHYTIPLSTRGLLGLISSGSTSVTIPGLGVLSLTIGAAAPVLQTSTTTE